MAPLRHLLLRAVVLYALCSAGIVVVNWVTSADGSGFGSALSAVLLTWTLGTIDIARRGETILWANLGFSRVVTSSLFGLTALCAEVTRAIVWQ